MNVTYIRHSGFYVELEQCAILFDYCRGVLPPVDFTKPLYIFISHHHSDHFTPTLFPLLRGHPAVTFVLSDDVREHFPPAALSCLGVVDCEYQAFRFVAPNGHYRFDGLSVDTLPSTDEGVAFLIQAEGKTFYHAGDLQLWPREALEESNAMEQQFHTILEPLRGQCVDAAFLMADPRQGESFAGGFDYFMRLTNTREAYPWDQEYNIDRLCAQICTEPYRSRICLANQCCLHVNLFSSLAL